MDKKIYNLIEKELYLYPRKKARAKIESLPSLFLMEIERRQNAIGEAINITKRRPSGGDRYKVIKLKYFDAGKTDEGIWTSIPCSRSTYFRWRQDFIKLVAEQLGWEV